MLASTLDHLPRKEVVVKSLVDLLEHLLQDCGRRSGAATKRDVETLRWRAEHEGDSFITITLPNFCKDFERSLSEGRVTPGMFLHFKKMKKSPGTPAFLSGFLCQVFAHDGTLLDNPSVDCIRSVRQICLFGKKIGRVCSEERMADAIEDYKKCEDEIVAPEGQIWEMFKKVARILIRSYELERTDLRDRFLAKHGPGATQEHILGNEKWRFRRWHARLHEVGLTHKFCMFGRSPIIELENYDGLDGPDFQSDFDADYVAPNLVEPEDEKPVRVVFVPKTMKGPRVIAVEPVCMQFAQQGLSRLLMDETAKSRLTAGHVNFRDQSVNQQMALDASGSGSYATLDMSEASDRVSVAHAIALLAAKPDFLFCCLAARSLRAKLPTGEILTLKKFASMGSALCFPVESLVFYTSIIASRLLRAQRFPTDQSVYEFSRSVYVFGDDLIVPTDEAPAICDDLEALGFKVNRHKSFWTGKFRESCGADCYDNSLVTPVYLRRDLPTDRKDASGIVSCLATANQLQRAGYASTAIAIRDGIGRLLGPNSLPQVPQDSPALGWWSDSTDQPIRRWNKHLQRFEYLLWTTVSPRDSDPLAGWEALAKCFRSLESRKDPRPWRFDEPPRLGFEHLEESPRPYSLALKRRWVPVDLS